MKIRICGVKELQSLTHCHLHLLCPWNLYWDFMWHSQSLFEWVLTVVWEAWLNGTTIAWITISPFCILVRRCGRASTCMCVCVLVLINTSSTWVLNWAECEIWQARVGLCGLPLHSNKTETCWHEYQMSEGVCCELSSITIWMIVAWKGRQSAISIFQYPRTDATTQPEAGCLA